MKRIFSLGLVLGLCGSLIVGCSNSMSDDDLEKCKEYEEYLGLYSQNADEIYDRLIELTTESEDMGDGDKSVLINGEKYKIISAKNDLNQVSLKDLEKYHDYMVEYRGTTQEEEDTSFLVTKYSCMKALLNLEYANAIVSLYEDGNISDEDLNMINNINEVRSLPVNEYLTEGSELEILRSDIYEKSGINYEEYLELVKTVSNIDFEEEEY